MFLTWAFCHVCQGEKVGEVAKVTSSDRNARVGTVGRTALPSFSESLQSNPPIGFFLGLASLFLRTESLLSVSSTLTVPTLLLKTPFQTFPLPVRDIPHALQTWQVRLEALVSSVVIFQVFPLHYRNSLVSPSQNTDHLGNTVQC